MEYQSVEDGLARLREARSTPERLPEQAPVGHGVPARSAHSRRACPTGHSPGEVLGAINDQLAQLGHRSAILAVDEQRRVVTVIRLALDPGALRSAEQLIGVAPQGYRFGLVSGGFFEDILVGGQVVFTVSCLEAIAEALPEKSRPLAGKLMAVLGLERAICAPLKAGGTVAGLLIVTGPEVSESDLPTIATVASQASIALQNAQACQVARRELDVRRQTERELTAAIEEKEALLKEIHHRVKNNLQVVSSLLSLQAMRVGDPESIAAFRDSQGRVRSMALIHESLYQSWSLAEIDFAEYVPRLVEALLQVYEGPARHITWSIDVSGVSLPMDLATPCGLILNELISNCLKHAFPDDGLGHVCVTFHRAGDGRFVLEVSDDGVGIPSDVDFGNAGTLGLQLVRMLAQQLKGTVEATSGDGTTVTVTFSQS